MKKHRTVYYYVVIAILAECYTATLMICMNLLSFRIWMLIWNSIILVLHTLDRIKPLPPVSGGRDEHSHTFGRGWGRVASLCSHGFSAGVGGGARVVSTASKVSWGRVRILNSQWQDSNIWTCNASWALSTTLKNNVSIIMKPGDRYIYRLAGSHTKPQPKFNCP